MRKTKKSFPARATAFFAVVLPAVSVVGPSAAGESPQAARGSNNSIDRFQQKFGTELLLLGPLTALDAGASSVDVLGQTVTMGPGMARDVAALRPGELVAVTGTVQPDGRILASRVVSVASDYVDGATEVLGTGVVTSLRAAVARATVGKLSLDYSPALHAGDPGIRVGSTIQFRGIRIGGTSSAIAFSISSLGAGANPNGSMGSGLNGSMGSGVNGSMGSGKRVIAKGSMGSGVNGSMGSGLNGSMGSGRNGSMGSGPNGSMGSKK